MFPDFSGLGDGMKSLNDKFEHIIALLEKIESNTRNPDTVAWSALQNEECRHG